MFRLRHTYRRSASASYAPLTKLVATLVNTLSKIIIYPTIIIVSFLTFFLMKIYLVTDPLVKFDRSLLERCTYGNVYFHVCKVIFLFSIYERLTCRLFIFTLFLLRIYVSTWMRGNVLHASLRFFQRRFSNIVIRFNLANRTISMATLFFRCFGETHFIRSTLRPLKRRETRPLSQSLSFSSREGWIRRAERVEGKGRTGEHLNTLTVKFKLPRVA